jgi:predicted Zn-dependent protease
VGRAQLPSTRTSSKIVNFGGAGMRIFFTSTLLATALLAGCGSVMVNPVTGESERSVMDESTEIAEGQKGHQQVLKEYGVFKSNAVQSYVYDLGQKLARQSHRKHTEQQYVSSNSRV